MRVVLFGASGFIGSHVAQQLVLSGHSVCCIVRLTSDCQFLHTLGVDIIRSEFRHIRQVAGYINTSDIVINCTADTRQHMRDDERRKVEVTLSWLLFKAAELSAAKRFIQLSTVMVYGFDRPAFAINENFPKQPSYSYNRIAWEREQVLLSLAEHSALPLMILRPANCLGKRDKSFLPSFIRSHRFSLFPVVTGGNWLFSCIDCRDIGRAMVHLLDLPSGQSAVFLVKGYDVSWLQFKEALDIKLGKTSKLMNMPKALMMIIGYLVEVLYPLGKEPPLTRFSMEVLSNDTLFDDSKIRATGFVPQYSLEASLDDTLDI